MSSFGFPQDNGQPDLESITFTDEAGRSLQCYIEQKLPSPEVEGETYLLLQPIDAPIAIIAWDEDEDEDEVSWIDDPEELAEVFEVAKAVLAEQNLTLKYSHSAYTPLAVSGELPPVEEDKILTLELEVDDPSLDTEEFQYLTSFFHEDQEYGIYTTLAPLLFFARQTKTGEVQLLSPEELQQVQPDLEELLFSELDE